MEGQIKAERTTEDILQEVQAIINNTSKESFLEYLLKEGAAEENNNYLFYCDFILDQIPELYFEHLVEMNINNYCIIHDEIIAKAAASYDRPTPEEIKQHKTFRTKEAGRSTSELIRLYPKRLNNINIMIDRPNSKIWNTRSIRDKEGKLPTKYITGTDNNTYSVITLDFNKVEDIIPKELDSYDKLIYSILATRFYSGEKIINLRQIYKDMGNNGKAGKEDLKKINDSITKMGQTWLKIDNAAEIEAGFKYQHITYDSSLLPFKRIKVIVKGKETTAIKILDEPPLMSFSRQRGQITTIPSELLRLPIRKEELTIQLNNYLYTYISHIKKNKKLSNKLTFSTICKACNIPEDRQHRVQRSRLYEKIVIILNHYKSCGFIKDYNQERNKNITFIV